MKKLLLFLFTLSILGISYGQKVQKALPSGSSGAESGDEYYNPFGSNTPTNTNIDALATWALPSDGSTSGNTRAPGNSYKYQRTEYLVTAAEMAASGFPSGYTIDAIGFLIATAGTTAQTGTFNVYLRNTTDVTYTLGATWTTTGFTQVSSIASWTVPIAVGSYIVNFAGGTPFTYTGGGVYVAWEFANAGTAGTGALVANCNTALTNGLYGYRGATLGTAMAVSSFRPATQFVNNSIVDIVDLTNIYTLEKVPATYGFTTPINVRVANVSAAAASFNVTVTVKDPTNTTTRFTQTQSVTSLAANTATIVSFTGWTQTQIENANITATTSVIPTETWTLNNSKAIQSNVNANTFGYDFANAGPSGFGFTYPGTGIFASKFTMKSAGSILSANLMISTDAANTGNTIYAVVLDDAGIIVAQSANYTILATDLGVNKNFTFPAPASFVAGTDFYVGLAQTAGTVQWYPMGTFDETPQRDNTFYTVAITGGTPSLLPNTFNLKYGVEAIVGAPPSVLNPSSFAASAVSSSEIDLSWALNANNNNVLLAWSPTGTFGTPSGSSYVPGSTISGGGTVLQFNNGTSFNHTGLSASTQYFYKAWSYNGSIYSPGATSNATTFCPSTPAPWSEAFETATFPPSCWDYNVGTGIWERTTTASGYGSGTGSAFADFYNTNGATPFALFTLPFTNGSLVNPKVSFDYAYATYVDEVDEMDVYYSTDGGANFTLLLAMPGGLTGILNTGGATSSLFVPTAAQWATQTISLPTGTNMIAFNAISAYGNSLYLDNVKIIEGNSHDAGTLSIDVPGTTMVNGTTVAPKATIKNFGTFTDSFNVNLSITGGYSSTKWVNNLAPGATVQVTFDSWTPALGNYTLDVCTTLPTDMDASNNCKSQATGVYTGSWSAGSAYPNTTYLGAGAGYTDNSVNPSVSYLFSIGGNTTSALGTECYKYNVTTNTWSTIAPLPSGRRVLAAACSGNFIYAIGGSDMASVYQTTVFKYDIAANTWSSVASLPVATGWGKAVAVGTNYIYFAGGVDGVPNYLATVYVYNISADTWTAASSMPGDKFGGAFSAVGNKLVYAAGSSSTGINSSVYVGTIDAGNPAIISWAAKASYPGINKETQRIMDIPNDAQVMPTGKALTLPENVRAAAYPAGAMYRFDGAPWGDDGMIVAGGSPTSAWLAASPSPCYLYKPATDTWIQQPNVAIPTTGPEAGSVTNGNGTWKLILAGGIDEAGASLSATQILTDVLTVPAKSLSVKVMIEGLYNGVGLNKAQGASGDEFPGTTADQVTIELRNSTTGALVYSLANVNLSTTGMISGTVPAVHNGSYYLYIKHRNSIVTSSLNPVSFAGGTISYDFSTGVTQAFGANMKDIGGVAVLFGGDENQDGAVESTDMIDCDNDGALFASGYLNTDINGDGVVDSSDMIIVDNNNTLFVGSVLPF